MILSSLPGTWTQSTFKQAWQEPDEFTSVCDVMPLMEQYLFN